MIKSLPDCALFLGLNGSMCPLVKDFPGLKPDWVYVTDDFLEYPEKLAFGAWLSKACGDLLMSRPLFILG
jgi:hypothetical protein